MLEAGPISIDRDILRAWVDGKVISLTSAQFDLLAFLLDNRRRVATHAEIARAVFNTCFGDVSLLVRVHICNLRRALAPRGYLLSNVRGRGYRIDLDRAVDAQTVRDATPCLTQS